MPAEVIVDLQYGSTGKGAVAAYLVGKKRYDFSVRVQSIQAGHTIYHEGKPYKMRTIPCAWVNPNITLLLGAGCFIEKQLLLEEISMIKEATGKDVRDRLILDSRAFYINEDDVRAEEGLDVIMGSTAHGAGASLIRKLGRREMPTRVSDDGWAKDNGLRVDDTIRLMDGKLTLAEGCQGSMLSIHTSPYYPFVTSRECTVAGIISEAGIASRDVSVIHGVLRSFPIRVGGNSGPTGGREMSWDEVSLRCGRDVKPERTTVTNKVRRIFEFSIEDFDLACTINKPDRLYMTFADYLAPGIYGKRYLCDLDEVARKALTDRLNMVYMASPHSQKPCWVGTGERAEHYFEMA